LVEARNVPTAALRAAKFDTAPVPVVESPNLRPALWLYQHCPVAPGPPRSAGGPNRRMAKGAMWVEKHCAVLVVEDDQSTAEFVQWALSDEGYHVEIARNGEEALRFVETQRPALVLLDIVLPVVDGIAVLQALRARWRRSIPVILMTAGRNGSEQAPSLEADGLLLKPFDLSDLLGLVRAWVGEPCVG